MGDGSSVGRAELDFASEGDIDSFVSMLTRFERGEIDADAWRTFRLLRGTYAQRQTERGVSMLRAKLPQGVVSAAQLETLADVADRYSRGFCHLTTRQNVQFHFVPLADIEGAMRLLSDVGITTREACGNSVRNVTTSPTAGVAPNEVFDPTPYARAFTRYFLRHPLSSSLPRKFKVAFSGGGADHSFALVNDLAFIAQLGPDGQRGFRVTVGGGTALMCKSGRDLVSFTPVSEVLALAEAVVRVFHAHGDREHRKKNRLKFLVKRLGWDAWRALVLEQLSYVRADGVPDLLCDSLEITVPTTRTPTPRPTEIEALLARDEPRGPGIVPRYLPVAGDPRAERFFASNVTPQRQSGFACVTIVVPLGDLTSGRLRAIAALARSFSDATVRTTIGQNLILRWVPVDRVQSLHRLLVLIGLAEPNPESIADVGSCPGAESCKLAVTQSRGLADHVGARFRDDRAWIDRAKGLSIRVSGCPNGCGLHHVASIGFQGGLRKVDGRAAPYYNVFVGGDAAGPAEARFGRSLAKLPARRAGEAIECLVTLYETKRNPGESINEYLGRVSAEDVAAALAHLDRAELTPEDFVDLAEQTVFRPEATEGECAA